MGVMSRTAAIELARSQGKDLVEVAPLADPIVCKIVDFGKYKYRQEKREKKQKRGGKLKEMRFTTQIDSHDFQTKVRRIIEFLEDDNKVKVTVIFRGREIVHMERGRELMQRLVDATAGIGRVDLDPKIRGRALQMVLVPGSSRPTTPEEKEKEYA
jgi:translation initiation factor IF-3